MIRANGVRQIKESSFQKKIKESRRTGTLLLIQIDRTGVEMGGIWRRESRNGEVVLGLNTQQTYVTLTRLQITERRIYNVMVFVRLIR